MADDFSSLTLMNDDYFIERYDAEMKLLSTKKIECPLIEGKVYDMDYLIVSGEDILLLASNENPITNTTDMRLFKLEPDGTIHLKPVAEWISPGIKLVKSVVYSPDSSKFAVVLSGMENKSKAQEFLNRTKEKTVTRGVYVVNYWIFEKGKEVYSKKNCMVEYEDLKFLPTQFFLGASNDLFLLVEYQLKKSEANQKYLQKFDLLKVNSANGLLEKLTLSQQDYFYFNWLFNWSADFKTIEVVGSVNTEEEKNTIGLFSFFINVSTFSMSPVVVSKFPEELFKKVDPDYRDKKKLVGFNLNQVYPFKDSSRLLIFEYQSGVEGTAVTFNSSPALGQSTMGAGTPSSYVYGDMLFVRINAQGQILWTDIICKSHVSYSPRNRRSFREKYFKEYLNGTAMIDYKYSYIPVVSENTISVLFHETPKRSPEKLRTFAYTISDRDFPKTVFLRCTFNPQGFVDSKILFDQSKSDYILSTGVYTQIKDKLLLYSESKNKFQWVKLNYTR